MPKKTLYFFTGFFPYNSKGESFINTELPYLSSFFERIVIIPLQAQNKDFAKLPNNCVVIKPIIKNKFHHYIIGLFGFKSLSVYYSEFLQNKVYSHMNWILQFVLDYCSSNVILQSKSLKKLLCQISKDDIMYFYWGKGLSNLTPFIRNIKAKKIVRFHGGDLYDCNYGGYIPLHKKILESIDLLVFISKHGQSYISSRYPGINTKSIVSYLGTDDYGISKKSTDGVFRLLSCSNVIPIKRVHLIFETVQSICDYPIEWTHIGNGSELHSLEKKIEISKSPNKVKLLGRLTHKEVFNYYIMYPIDAFINVSSTEGLPVSLMEAISFNVPIIGTDVGGTSEIVVKETGVLLSANPEINEIINAIEIIRNSTLEPRLFWENNFYSKKNYLELIDHLLKM